MQTVFTKAVTEKYLPQPQLFLLFFSLFFPLELGTEPRALQLLGKSSTTELTKPATPSSAFN